MQLRSAAAVAVVWASTAAPIRSLAWELPYAADAVIKRKKKNLVSEVFWQK